MKSLIDKNKKISKQRQEFVEHNFEAMVGARKRRYNDTQAQKQRTEFFEDYYLLYTRNKQELDQQKAMWNELEKYIIDSSINYNISQETKDWFARIIVKMQELEQGEKDGNNK